MSEQPGSEYTVKDLVRALRRIPSAEALDLAANRLEELDARIAELEKEKEKLEYALYVSREEKAAMKGQQ